MWSRFRRSASWVCALANSSALPSSVFLNWCDVTGGREVFSKFHFRVLVFDRASGDRKKKQKKKKGALMSGPCVSSSPRLPLQASVSCCLAQICAFDTSTPQSGDNTAAWVITEAAMIHRKRQTIPVRLGEDLGVHTVIRTGQVPGGIITRSAPARVCPGASLGPKHVLHTCFGPGRSVCWWSLRSLAS